MANGRSLARPPSLAWARSNRSPASLGGGGGRDKGRGLERRGGPALETKEKKQSMENKRAGGGTKEDKIKFKKENNNYNKERTNKVQRTKRIKGYNRPR
ncbi:hypothetical protein NDU88_004981 [Pleurodeles waltl]|uniref:Uncharacterized protein n=1 Tax=Pleurodeles waltl TaxID=8319 RepID=A0AAV7WA76_PLEWA|nr:hypothetical protein NDU88_004981 [Pleurodeles waltl]